MTIAITGATGHLGRLAIAALKTRVDPGQIIALARDPAKAADLGVAARIADYAKPETLAPALAGVTTLVLIAANELGQRVVQHSNVIAAAKAAGVSRIIFTSLLHADVSTLGLAGEYIETERVLKASGVPFTILRNGWYAENYTASFGGALAGGAFVGSAGEGRISAAARADLAEAIAVVATSDGHVGKTYELAGDAAWTLADLAAELSRQTGRDLPYKDLPEADYAGVLIGAGLPQALAGAIASWDVSAKGGALFDDTRQLSSLIGRPTTPLAVSVTEALQALNAAKA